MPRAALTSLHARMAEVTPGSWEHPSLWQVWFRMADYVIPARDFGVFTLGSLPRHPERRAFLVGTAEAVAGILDGRSLDSREAAAALAGRTDLGAGAGFALREACCAGRYRIRWDARRVTVIPAPTPAVDAEEARRELARRFLRWHGPAAPGRFAKWAHVSPAEAAETFRQLEGELIPVAAGGEQRWLHQHDEQALREAAPVAGVRFLMLGDPLLALDRETFEPPPASLPEPAQDDLGRPVTRRLRNSLAGRVLIDGAVAGSWGRHQHHLAVHLWLPADASTWERVEAEAASFAGPIGRPMEICRLT